MDCCRSGRSRTFQGGIPWRCVLAVLSCLFAYSWPPLQLASSQPLEAKTKGLQSEAAKLPRTDLYGDPLPEKAVVRLGSPRFHFPDNIHSVAFSPDGNTILACGYEDREYTLIFWAASSGKELSRFKVPDFCWGATFSPDGKAVVLGTNKTKVRVVSTGTAGKVLRTFEHKRDTHYFALSPDGSLLAVGQDEIQGSEQNVIHLWEVATGRQLPPFFSAAAWAFTC